MVLSLPAPGAGIRYPPCSVFAKLAARQGQASGATMIDRRQIGRSGVVVTALGFGGGPLGRLATDTEAQATLEQAWEAGIRYFDTAPLYGHGQSERRLGSFLRHQPRADFAISSKVGRLLGPGSEIVYDYSRDGTLRSLELSLGRLGLDAIDIAYVHDIDRYTHGDDQPRRLAEALDGALPTLLDLRSRGVVRAIGLGVNEWQVARDVAHRLDIDCVLLAGRYTLLEQGAAREFLPLCRERGIGVIIGGPYNSGILATGAAGHGDLQLQAAAGRRRATRAAHRGRAGPPWREAADRGPAVPAARGLGRRRHPRHGLAARGGRGRRTASRPSCRRRSGTISGTMG